MSSRTPRCKQSVRLLDNKTCKKCDSCGQAELGHGFRSAIHWPRTSKPLARNKESSEMEDTHEILSMSFCQPPGQLLPRNSGHDSLSILASSAIVEILWSLIGLLDWAGSGLQSCWMGFSRLAHLRVGVVRSHWPGAQSACRHGACDTDRSKCRLDS